MKLKAPKGQSLGLILPLNRFTTGKKIYIYERERKKEREREKGNLGKHRWFCGSL
jgi:hypothetical protein